MHPARSNDDRSPGARLSRLNSFQFALRGIRQGWQSQPNVRIQTGAGLLAIGLGLTLNLVMIEWAALILCIALVIALEYMNSALEGLADTLHPDFSEGIGKAKDLAAAAVLIASVGTLAVGTCIFLPKLLNTFTA